MFYITFDRDSRWTLALYPVFQDGWVPRWHRHTVQGTHLKHFGWTCFHIRLTTATRPAGDDNSGQECSTK